MYHAKNPVTLRDEHLFPSVPMYNRRESFTKFDLDTLFFAFYYEQGTYQQYLAAIELKKKNWMFHKKYHTWFRKTEGQETLQKVTFCSINIFYRTRSMYISILRQHGAKN